MNEADLIGHPVRCLHCGWQGIEQRDEDGRWRLIERATPRERAEDVAKRIIRAWVKSATNHAHLVVGVDESRVSTEPQVEEAKLVALLADAVAAEVQRAVEAEREACAAAVEAEIGEYCKVDLLTNPRHWCEDYGCSTLFELAAAIRARQHSEETR